MLVKYATLWLFTLPLFLLRPVRAVSIFCFGLAQAFKRRFCYVRHMLLFDVSASNYAPFWGVKYASKRRLCS